MKWMHGSNMKIRENDKDRYVIVFQSAMLVINYLAVIFICTLVYSTSEKIRREYSARTFLDSVNTIPENPKKILIACMILMGMLMLTFMVRQYENRIANRWIVCSLIAEFVICAIIIYLLDFNYNGLLLLVFANVIAYARDGKMKLLFVSLAIIGYLVADYSLLSINIPLFNFTDYVHYYSSDRQQYLLGIFNILNSLNMILFIVYCVFVINEQRDTIEEVNSLYHELQTANEQLQEYADMSERMAQTRERNRLAREIHDTLGHTLTGIAMGLDACMALIDISPEMTKEQLEKLSTVSREGITDIRRSVNELRPDALERLSLDVAIRKMITDMSKMSDVQIFFETDVRKMQFDEDEENAIYRVIQESITNAVRHGKAKKIWITMQRQEGEIVLTIRDNGIGCKEIKSGFGTRHIRERIEMLRGTVSFDGHNGFTVTANIPIRWGETYDD
ncbi:MAG: sensor histidine kinase [Muricoprocola sp.]